MAFTEGFEPTGFVRSVHPTGGAPSGESVPRMKVGEGAPSSPQDGSSLDARVGAPLGEVRQANVPVVVLGATIGGLATAVAIRSRTGRAVCVIDVGSSSSSNENEADREDTTCFLSARSLDAVRAINADLYRALLASVAEEAAAGAAAATPAAAAAAAASPMECSFDLPVRISCALLRRLLLEHLTSGAGGSSCLWRSSRIQQIACYSAAAEKNKKEIKAADGVVILFENGIVVKTGLLVVATQNVSPLAKTGERIFRDESNQPIWFLRGPETDEVPLLNQTEKRSVTFAAASPHSAAAVFSQSPGPNASGDSEKETPREETETANAALLSAVFEKIKKTPATLRSNGHPKDVDSSWSFCGGSLILTGSAAHPWISSVCDCLELDLEDAAQLGCSLYDWKFALRMASDRFQAIRKRRIASIFANPRLARGFLPGSPEGNSGTSTVATSPEAFLEEDETFVPRRDAYAELLPAAGLGYEVQEAQLLY